MKDITSRPTNYAVLELFLKRVYQSKKVDFFPLFMQALSKGWCKSKEYAPVKAIRRANADCTLMIVDGV